MKICRYETLISTDIHKSNEKIHWNEFKLDDIDFPPRISLEWSVFFLFIGKVFRSVRDFSNDIVKISATAADEQRFNRHVSQLFRITHEAIPRRDMWSMWKCDEMEMDAKKLKHISNQSRKWTFFGEFFNLKMEVFVEIGIEIEICSIFQATIFYELNSIERW